MSVKPESRRRRLILTTGAWALFLLLLPLAGCESSITGVERQDKPFYYYFDQKIYLEVDPDELIVASLSDDSATVAQGLQRAGVLVRVLQYHRMKEWIHHWLVQVEGKKNTTALAQRLWTREDFVFAAPVYYGKESGGRIELMDGLVVRMKDDATAEDRERIASRYGLYPWDNWSSSDSNRFSFGLPASANFTALELAAAIHRRPEVEWAEVSMLQEIQFGSHH